MSAYTEIPLKNKSYLKEYNELIQFLKNSKTVSFRAIMGNFFMTGFDKRDIFDDDDDSFTTQKKIINSLDKYGFDTKLISEHLF